MPVFQGLVEYAVEQLSRSLGPRFSWRFISQLYSLDVDKVMEHYKLWGPSLHTCFDLVAGTLSTRAMERETMLAARKFAESKIPLMNDTDPSDPSDILFLIYPEDSSRQVMRAKIATDHIFKIVLGRLSWFAEQSHFST